MPFKHNYVWEVDDDVDDILFNIYIWHYIGVIIRTKLIEKECHQLYRTHIDMKVTQGKARLRLFAFYDSHDI